MKVIKFYAEWCGPCKVVGNNLKNAHLPIPVMEVNVEDDDDLVAEYGVRSVPVTVFLDDSGKEMKRWIGIFDVNEIKECISRCVSD